MKRYIAAFAAFIFMIMPISAFADGASDNADSKISLYLSVFDDVSESFYLTNTKVFVSYGADSYGLLQEIKEQGIIKDFTFADNILKGFIPNDGNQLIVKGENQFYLKINGTVFYDFNVVFEQDDIVEFICGVPPVTALSGVSVSGGANTEFSEEMRQSFAAALKYINLNKDKSESYLMLMGVLNKTADSKILNRSLSSLRKRDKYESVSELNKDIISFTMAGYDMSGRIVRLMAVSDIGKSGNMSLANALIAYNSGNYEIYEKALNSHSALKKELIANQKENGAFGITSNSKDSVDATAMILTALSPYIQESAAGAAVKRGFEFLESQYSQNVFFGEDETASETISQVIIALVSAEEKSEKLILDELVAALLDYQNADGGFAHLMSDKTSNMIATEQALIALNTLKTGKYPYYREQILLPIEQNKLTILSDELSSLTAEEISLAAVACIIAAMAIVISIYMRAANNKKKAKEV